MDSKGFIKDVSIRIVPSQKMVEFIKNLKACDDLPISLQAIVNDQNLKETLKSESTQTVTRNGDSYMLEKDFKLLKTLLKDSNCKPESNHVESKPNDEVPSKESESDKSPVSEDSANVIENFLYIRDLKWLSGHLEKVRNEGESIYLHELLEGSEVVLPENEVIKRNPVLEARCVRLRKEQDNQLYRNMTKNVDNVRKKQPEDSIAYQMKAINTHLIAIFQFILSVGAGFLFGFIGVELMIGNLDFGFRLLLGVMCALIIALAEIYFLARKLNEDLAIETTIQVGGPPVYPDEIRKLHKD